jgi:hypothetical protein
VTRHGDARCRVRDGQRTTVGAPAAAEPLLAVPFPAVIEDPRVVSAQALVSWHGNSYSVPPGTAGSRSPSAPLEKKVLAARGAAVRPCHRKERRCVVGCAGRGRRER